MFLLLLVAGGAIVTVAVAWGCVKLSDKRPTDDIPVPAFNANAISPVDRAWLAMNGLSSPQPHPFYGPYAVMPSEMIGNGITRIGFF